MKTQYNITTGALLLLIVLNTQANSLTVTEEASAFDDKNRSSTLFYWTRERIAKAPAIMMIDKKKPSAPKKSSTTALTHEVPMSTKGGSPAPNSNAIHRQAFAEAWKKLETEFGALYIESAQQSNANNEAASTNVLAGTSGVYINYDVNTVNALWKILPHKWIDRKSVV